MIKCVALVHFSAKTRGYETRELQIANVFIRVKNHYRKISIAKLFATQTAQNVSVALTKNEKTCSSTLVLRL